MSDIETTTVSEEGFASTSQVGEFDMAIDPMDETGPNPNAALVATYASCFLPALRVAGQQMGHDDLGTIQIDADADLDDEDDLSAIRFTIHVEADLADEDVDEAGAEDSRARFEAGEIALDDPLEDYIPAFADAHVATALSPNEDYRIDTVPLERSITIADLLTHTSGIGYIFDYETPLGAIYLEADIYAMEDADLAERMERLAQLPLYFQPGERWYYSYANDVLGRVVEVASGESLEAYMDANIFTPLGMEDTTFFPDAAMLEDAATLYTHNGEGELVEVPVDEDALRSAEVEAGGAGLWSTAADYMRFALALANGGALDGARILKPETVALMIEDHTGLERMPQAMASSSASSEGRPGWRRWRTWWRRSWAWRSRR